MSSLDTSTQQSAQSGKLVVGVDAAVATMVSDGRLAGPASVQDNLADLIPSNDALGAYCSLEDGTIAIVLLVPAAAEELSPGFDGAALAGALAPVLDTAATAMGLSSGLANAVGVDDLAALLAGAETIVAAGVFDGSDVAATVITAGGPAANTTASMGFGAASSAKVPDFAAMGAQVERGLQILGDVNLEVTAELGRTSVSVNSLLDLEPGAVLELNNPAGSPVDLLVNGTLFARAEVVVVNDTYAVRISHLVGDGPLK